MCGGTSLPLHRASSITGLSPRVRGNLYQLLVLDRGLGSIPACAGEPIQTSCNDPVTWVYPRVCGGTSVLQRFLQRSFGLSPRVRGNPYVIVRHPASLRSIPACAGEPQRQPLPSRLPRVYPRVCGGTTGVVRNTIHVRGLSPRVRGNPRSTRSWWRRTRSIPACAGEPLAAALGQFLRTVYPRVCGGTAMSKGTAQIVHGLSPRVRGNRASAASA